MSRCRAAHDAAYLSILAITQHRQGGGEHIVHASSVGDDMRRFSWWPEPVDSDALDGKAGAGPLSAAAQRWLANVRPDVSSDGHGGALYASPLANRPDPEYPVCMELLATVRAELEMEVPRTKKDLNRPVTVLAVLNRRGRSVAMSVMNDIATDLKADVVHLDASSIAALVGKHLGQTQYWSKGAVSMLGYAAAEMNGRLASRSSQSDSDMESEFGGMVTVALPPRLRSMLRKDSSISIGGSSGGPFDDRWEDLKMNQALDDLISSADAKRGNNSKGKPPRDLIIHIHDYIEISSLHESIISKLRLMVDRMRQRGRRVVIVGSSASDVHKQPNWKDQLLEMGRDGDVHILPFHAAAAKDGNGDEISSSSELEEKCDNLDDNIFNIATMLRSLLPSASVTFESELRRIQHGLVLSTDYMVLAVALSQHVFDAQWVYRLASIMIGSRFPRFQEFGIDHLKYAFDFMSDRNQHWTRLYPGVKPPYFSPLHAQNKTLPSFMSEDSPFSGIPPNLSSGGSSSDNNSNASHGPRGRGEYDQHEKKLLSGLINAKDIHTTFNDIIVPPETKESLTALTSLSLERPDAFSYGVLKTERIPGCLLYGPPGTGKTLLAKAVAKESGANMLEVSAASINDMWLGQSEKNVRALFSLAKKLSPMVIFLDEADALLGARHNGPGRSGHRETITQFLREWDGLSDMRAFIMVATNRPFDLDEAVLRRLPRRILVDLPLKEERLKILKVMLKDELLAEDVDLEKLATDETELYSGSDLKNLCVSAAMAAVRDECKARDEYIATQKKKEEEEEKGVKDEKEEAEEVEGEGEKKKYEWPAKRTLTRQHFDRALRDITASISEDMESLKAIRKFDEQYGDAGRNRRNKGKRSMGFEVVPLKRGTQEARVRQL
ncbi:P-loop containing nucleoside triphosphate hydrolase protein [Diplogelasinospora grovesii]|uniref:P-loop containing nucleoside triphosphate hydrolase protein n=1 Tax=Diplogelasinospora grovesii TaxID=303347 RepID=A0AAN6S9R0_9PEZI|nr:P-loop containing nucleoside triphosphate hydrolase protein [Diplogelasinospora grovesii]